MTAAYVHYQVLRDPLYTSFCDISARVSCSEVYQSRFSTFQGVPVAVFAGIWSRPGGPARRRRHGCAPEVRERASPGHWFALTPALAR